MHLRLATTQDAAAIATIYNQGIEDRVATFETRLRTPQEIEQWFDGVHPIVVLQTDERQVIIFASKASTVPAPATRASPSSRSMSHAPIVGAALVVWRWRGFSRKRSRRASGNWCRGSLWRMPPAARCSCGSASARWGCTKSTPNSMVCGVM